MSVRRDLFSTLKKLAYGPNDGTENSRERKSSHSTNLTEPAEPMPTQKEVTGPISTQKLTENTVFAVLIAISVSHLLNDTIQSVIPAIYPILKESFHLSFTQIGLITLTFQLTASLLQPFVGLYTDHRPKPYSLAIGMGFTLVGLVLLSRATNFPVILCSAALVGMGSSVFHPEASRLARMASGGRHGFAQSIFQVGGNAGTSLGPLLAALIIVPSGQQSVGWFSLVALVAIIVLANVGHWYKQNLHRLKTGAQAKDREGFPVMSRSRIIWALAVLIALMFSKFFYLSSMTNYFTFYLIDKFRLSVQEAQLHLFLFLFSVAAGTIIGGHLGDRFGRKYVIWGSILGVAPFTLLLPYANLFWTGVLTIVIGIILASAFSAILVYAQELVPGKVGMISGLFFGFAFGMGGIGSAALGRLADQTSINFVFLVCSFLPLIGLLTAFLPDLSRNKKRAV
jgi:MFS transporter, FSR family, fosmidomycin resistance protein